LVISQNLKVNADTLAEGVHGADPCGGRGGVADYQVEGPPGEDGFSDFRRGYIALDKAVVFAVKEPPVALAGKGGEAKIRRQALFFDPEN
jgi:hypothetical protein